jgi:hypothetical protein
MYGHRKTLDNPRSSTGLNPNAWPLRLLPEKSTKEAMLGREKAA